MSINLTVGVSLLPAKLLRFREKGDAKGRGMRLIAGQMGIVPMFRTLMELIFNYQTLQTKKCYPFSGSIF
jgi:hypothetical protein